MQIKSRRRVRAAAFATFLVATGVMGWVPLGGAASTVTPNPDTILYSQQTGNNGTYILYVPGDGSKTTKEGITSGGGCATPSPVGAPLLNFGAKYYPNGYANPSTGAIVGAFKSRTGVCQISQAWSIEVNEGLVFSVGSSPLTVGRLFTRAQIKLEREDKSTSTSAPVTGRLIERVGSSQVGSTPFSISGPDGTGITGDTGTVPTGFDSIEIQVLTPSVGSVSVVGPTSTFTFASKICAGQTITSTSNDGTAASGEVTADVTYLGTASGPACKSYTFFGADANDPASTTGKSVSFLSQEVTGAHITATFDWGYFPYCRADATADPNVPACPTTYFVFNDGTSAPQTYCSSDAALNNPAVPWCTVSRHYDYVSVNGVTLVHITETWDGMGDSGWRFS
jgi:hypothetical protein